MPEQYCPYWRSNGVPPFCRESHTTGGVEDVVGEVCPLAGNRLECPLVPRPDIATVGTPSGVSESPLQPPVQPGS